LSCDIHVATMGAIYNVKCAMVVPEGVLEYDCMCLVFCEILLFQHGFLRDAFVILS